MLAENLQRYIEAAMPIIYVNSYDDNTVEELVLEVTGRRKVWEWNRLMGGLNRKEINRNGIEMICEQVAPDTTLEMFLMNGIKDREFDKKVIVIKERSIV